MTRDTFSEIRGHEALISALSRAIREDRVASALLFHGPSGVGKLTTALALFRGLLCDGAGRGACGGCDSCRRVSPSALMHPDVGLLWPQPQKGKARGETEEEGGEVEKAPADRPAGSVDLQALQEEVRQNGRWQILAEPTRHRLGELFLSPGGGKRRVLLILSAERLGNVSGNILLKVLEEPPGSAVIVLLCESPSALLPTIRSRCQSCRFSPLPRAVVEDFLRGQGAAPPDEARLIASLAGGRIGTALLLARGAGTYRARRDLLSRLLSELRREKSAAACLTAARELISEEAEEDLSILMDILRDAMLSDAGCPPSLLTDARPGRVREPQAVTAFQAASLLPRVEKAREDLRRYVNRQVAVETLFLDLADPFPPPPEGE